MSSVIRSLVLLASLVIVSNTYSMGSTQYQRPSLGIQAGDGDVIPIDIVATNNRNGAIHYSGEQTLQSGNLVWDITVGQLPELDVSFSITNTSVREQTYTIDVRLPMPSANSISSTILGTLHGKLIDNGDGAVLRTVNNSSIYTALVDGQPIANLLKPKTEIHAVSGSKTIETKEFSIANDANDLIRINSSIAKRFTFSLTPGDEVIFTSQFHAAAVPLPVGALVFGFGLIGMMIILRQRNKDTFPTDPQLPI